MDKDSKLMCTGAGGTVIAALCCFTPLLGLVLGALGLGTWYFGSAVGWIDWVLFPVMFAFMALTGYALWRRTRRAPRAGADAGS